MFSQPPPPLPSTTTSITLTLSPGMACACVRTGNQDTGIWNRRTGKSASHSLHFPFQKRDPILDRYVKRMWTVLECLAFVVVVVVAGSFSPLLSMWRVFFCVLGLVRFVSVRLCQQRVGNSWPLAVTRNRLLSRPGNWSWELFMLKRWSWPGKQKASEGFLIWLVTIKAQVSCILWLNVSYELEGKDEQVLVVGCILFFVSVKVVC